MILNIIPNYFIDFCDRFCARYRSLDHIAANAVWGGVTEGQWRRWHQTPFLKGTKSCGNLKRQKGVVHSKGTFTLIDRKRTKRTTRKDSEAFLVYEIGIYEGCSLSLLLLTYSGIVLAWLTLVLFCFLTLIFKTSFCWLISVWLLTTIHGPRWSVFFPRMVSQP